jgi:hypothetical protein
VLLVGGGDIVANQVRANLFMPTPNDPALVITGLPDRARRFHAAVSLGGGYVLIVGGDVLDGAIGPTRTAELYVRAIDSFAALDDMRQARSQPAAFLLADNQVLITGGTRSLAGSDEFRSLSNRESELYSPGPDGVGVFSPIDIPLSFGRSAVLSADVFGRAVVAVGSHRDGIVLTGDERSTPQHMVDVLEPLE